MPPTLEGYDGCYAPTTNDQEHCQVLPQLHEKVVRAALAQAEEPFSMDPPASAAPTKEGPSLSVASATTNPATSSGASSQDAPTEESMKLDYTNNSSVLTNSQLATTPQVVSSSSDAAIATNIATLTAPEAGSSGSIDTANTVSECLADIVSNKEVEALKMDE
ncbi:hypothetical protein C0989_006876 [Termitomyces sp. Mn162]|nr:hypothetical protein C0989_006876 [Termitomyces sp. Mn162]